MAFVVSPVLNLRGSFFLDFEKGRPRTCSPFQMNSLSGPVMLRWTGRERHNSPGRDKQAAEVLEVGRTRSCTRESGAEVRARWRAERRLVAQRRARLLQLRADP